MAARDTTLFGQDDLTVDVEFTAHAWRLSIGLAASDADCVIARSDHRSTILGHNSQIAIFQLKVDLLARARFEMNALKPAQSNLRCALDRRKLEIDLHRFVACNLAAVGHRHIGANWLSSGHSLSRNAEIAVLEMSCS